MNLLSILGINMNSIAHVATAIGITIMLMLLWKIKTNDVFHIHLKLDNLDGKVESYHKEVSEIGKEIVEIKTRCEERCKKDK